MRHAPKPVLLSSRAVLFAFRFQRVQLQRIEPTTHRTESIKVWGRQAYSELTYIEITSVSPCKASGLP